MTATIVTYLFHYLFARGVWQTLSGHGVSTGTLIIVGLAGSAVIALWRRRGRR